VESKRHRGLESTTHQPFPALQVKQEKPWRRPPSLYTGEQLMTQSGGCYQYGPWSMVRKIFYYDLPAHTHTHARTHAHAHAHTCTRTRTQENKACQARWPRPVTLARITEAETGRPAQATSSQDPISTIKSWAYGRSCGCHPSYWGSINKRLVVQADQGIA
jgi:hypothetical protein